MDVGGETTDVLVLESQPAAPPADTWLERERARVTEAQLAAGFDEPAPVELRYQRVPQVAVQVEVLEAGQSRARTAS